MRVAIVGCGKIADVHTAQILALPGTEIVGFCDRELLMAQQLAERTGNGAVFDKLEELIDAVQPDVLHITTPPGSHFELARTALEAGCHVLVEKPFTLWLDEARKLIEIANRNGLKLTAGHMTQFSPEMQKMRGLVSGGFLGGQPAHMESIYTYSLDDPSYAKAVLADRTHWVRKLPGSLLHNLISHGVAKLAEFLNSEDPQVFAHAFTSPTLRARGEDTIVDELRVVIEADHGQTAYFTFTTQIQPARQELRLFGPRGSICVDNLHRTVITSGQHDSSYKSYLNFLLPPWFKAREYRSNVFSNAKALARARFHMDAGLRNLLSAFYESIGTGATPPMPYREILLTALIMERIFDQMRSNLDATSNSTPRPAIAQ